jgi:hypothetical protein
MPTTSAFSDNLSPKDSSGLRPVKGESNHAAGWQVAGFVVGAVAAVETSGFTRRAVQHANWPTTVTEHGALRQDCCSHG